MSQPNPQWRIVEQLSLPVPMYGLKGVTLGEDFYISGGYQESEPYNSDQFFRMFCDEGQCQIQKMTQTLQVARIDHVFLLLPASLANC